MLRQNAACHMKCFHSVRDIRIRMNVVRAPGQLRCCQRTCCTCHLMGHQQRSRAQLAEPRTGLHRAADLQHLAERRREAHVTSGQHHPGPEARRTNEAISLGSRQNGSMHSEYSGTWQKGGARRASPLASTRSSAARVSSRVANSSPTLPPSQPGGAAAAAASPSPSVAGPPPVHHAAG